MRLALITLPDVDDVELASFAEEHGFGAFYVGENPLMWSSSAVALALAAQRTERIHLGSGVAIAGLHHPAATAQAMATINRLAPGRVSCGVGTGNSAMRVLGRDPMSVRAYERYVAVLAALLHGEEATVGEGEEERVLSWMVPAERGYASFDPPVPLYVSAFGPRSMAIAGRYGDGILSYLGATAEQVEAAWEPLEAGAAAAGRTLDRETFFTSSMLMMCVLRDGEDPDSPRIRAQAAPVAMLTVHYCYEQFKQLGTPPPPFLESIWDEYVAAVEAVPTARRGLRIHRGHGEWVPEEDRRFVTTELLQSTCMIAPGAEIAAQLRSLATANLDEVAINPSPETSREVIEDIHREVLPHLWLSDAQPVRSGRAPSTHKRPPGPSTSGRTPARDIDHA